MRFFLTGFMGCGKSFWGSQIAKHFSLPFFDLDKFIEQEENTSIRNIFTLYGEKHFRNLESSYLHYLIARHQHFIMATGGGTPCHHHNMELINSQGISIYIKATPEYLVSKLHTEMAQRPLIQHLTQSELFNFVNENLVQRSKYYEMATYTIDANSIDTSTFENIINSYV